MKNIEENILVVGSLNSHISDRELANGEVKTVQCLDSNNVFTSIPFFEKYNNEGVSSFCFENEEIVFYTTGDRLFRLDLVKKQEDEITVTNIDDIHEMSIIEGVLFLSNTTYNEAVGICLNTLKPIVRKEIVFDSNRNKIQDSLISEQQTKEDKFHCNQVFSGYSGSLYALVHHTQGKQLINRVKQSVVKSQGDGGVINLMTGEAIQLKLKAPHSVRLVNNQYWVFNSGHSCLSVYDKSWNFVKEIKMLGWGRGGDFSSRTKLYYAGVSATRKRYLFKYNNANRNNYIQVFNSNGDDMFSIIVPNVEQVNNLYIITDRQKELLLDFV